MVDASGRFKTLQAVQVGATWHLYETETARHVGVILDLKYLHLFQASPDLHGAMVKALETIRESEAVRDRMSAAVAKVSGLNTGGAVRL